MIVRGEEYSPFHLARLAGCADPDSADSAGTEFLLSVASSVADWLEEHADDQDFSDAAAEIADQAPDVYTHTMWSEFVDLAAYREDPTDLGADGSDMEQAARVCLYIIAERLAIALFDGES